MSSKVLLVLLMFLATIILISSEVAPDDAYENFDKIDGKPSANGVDESKYWRGGYGGGYRGWRGGYGGGRGGYGGWRGGYGGGRGGYGGWRGGYGGGRGGYGGWGGGYGPNEHNEAGIDANPHN